MNKESKIISEIDRARLKLSIEHYIKYFIGKRTCEITKDEALEAIALAGRTDGAAGSRTGMQSGKDIFIIGGGEIYRQAVPLADRMYITEVHTAVEDADTFFPSADAGEWREESRSERHVDPLSGLEYEFVIYSRKSDREQL